MTDSPDKDFSPLPSINTEWISGIVDGTDREIPGRAIAEFVYKNGRTNGSRDMQISVEFSLFPYFSQRRTVHACARTRARARLYDSSGDTPFPTEVFSEKGEITEVRKECETERRTLNGIRIGRVPSISFRYYVIASFSPVRSRHHVSLTCTHVSRFIVFPR